MSFLGSPYFWGALVMVIGVSILLNAIFPKLEIPLLRIAFGLFILYLGISIIVGRPGMFLGGKNTIIFSNSETKLNRFSDLQQETNVVFGSRTIDLSEATNDDKVEREISIVFGSTILRINPKVPIEFDVSAAFASINTPDGNVTSFGKHNYKSSGQNGNPDISTKIKVHCVFGETKIIAD